MSDELDDLARALHAATPEPDTKKRAAVLARASEAFEKKATESQGLATEPRQTSDRPLQGFVRGVREMLSTLSTRAVLGATTATAVLGVVLVSTLNTGAPSPRYFGSYEKADAPLSTVQTETASRVELEVLIESPVILEEAPAPALVRQRAAPAADMAISGQVSGLVASEPMILPAPIPGQGFEADTEAFPESETNPVKVTAEEPVSTFSVDVDTASYAILRSSLERGMLPVPDAVRVEEMINYFDYGYSAPEGDAPFSVSLGLRETPWNAGTQLVRIGLQGALPQVEDRPPLNLVFLVDTSGSMRAANKLPLLKQSLGLLLSELRPEDQVAIVSYAGAAGVVLDPTPAAETRKIRAALDALTSGGGTAGQAGLQQAYALVEEMQSEGEVSRVLLATDGDFNVGLSDPDALEDFIAGKRESGAYLSVLGFGRGNLDDATMQALAQVGNGTAAYIDTLSEARKVLVDQLTGALFPIADDVKVQVEWNPAQVAEYRLIGYETRALRREDFNNDRVDAGEIGAGHQVTALYEITPMGSAARLTDPLRYEKSSGEAASDDLGFLRLRYKAPGADESQLIEQPITNAATSDPALDYAAAIAGFGQLLRDAPYLGDWSYDDAIALANNARGADAFGYRGEAVQLMRLAQSLDQ